MRRLWQQIGKGEKGQVLPIVLAVLIIGGLMIAPALNHVATSLNAGRIVEENVEGTYAAEAGVEKVMWYLKNSISPIPEQLTENINQMQVSMQTEDKGTYSLYYGELVESEKHYDWLGLDMVKEEGDEAYKCTVTLTWSAIPGSPSIKLEEVGMRLPIGYEYVEDSAADFAENLSTDEPDITQDWATAYIVRWDMPSPRPEVSETTPTATQTFYITGEGELDGDYACVEAQSGDIGKIGEVIGTFYSITSTATNPETSEITATLVADIVVDDTDGEVYVISWKVSPQ